MNSILWVEDEKDTFKIFSHNVLIDYDVKIANDYESALKFIKEIKFDLYIIDIILPSGKMIINKGELTKLRETYFGLELIYKIREVDKITPIIVLSVVNDTLIVNKIRNAGSKIEILWKYDSEPIDVKKLCDKYLKNSV